MYANSKLTRIFCKTPFCSRFCTIMSRNSASSSIVEELGFIFAWGEFVGFGLEASGLGVNYKYPNCT